MSADGGQARPLRARSVEHHPHCALAGSCMCHDTLRVPVTGDHVWEESGLWAGQVVFHDGDAEVAEGVTVHCIAGHSRGLQRVRGRTREGWIVPAADAVPDCENFLARKPIPIVVDLQEMFGGFDRLGTLARDMRLIVPGRDPLVWRHFPTDLAHHVFGADGGPQGDHPGA